MKDRRLIARIAENGWSEDAASVAIDAGIVDIEIAGNVFGKPLRQLCHGHRNDDPTSAISSIFYGIMCPYDSGSSISSCRNPPPDVLRRRGSYAVAIEAVGASDLGRGRRVFRRERAASPFCEGSSLEEAVEAFATDLVYYWRYYNSLRDDEVAGAGLELKRIYEGLVRPE